MMMGDHTVLVQPLATAQPLAHRLLKNILVECPLKSGVSCRWKGDYGDLQAHLLSSTAHSEDDDDDCEASATTNNNTPTPMEEDAEAAEEEDSRAHQQKRQKQQQSLATSLKEEANGKFQSSHYRDAQSLYTKAIEVLQTQLQQKQLDSVDEEASRLLLATLYSNRAATHLQLQEYSQCLEDCQHVLQQQHNLEESSPSSSSSDKNVKVYVRANRACIQLGQLHQAGRWLEQGLERHPQHSGLVKDVQTVQRLVALQSQGEDQLSSQQQYAAAKGTYGRLLKEAPSAVPFLLGAAQADLGLGLTDSALRLTKRVLTKHAQNPQGCSIRGQAIFLMGDCNDDENAKLGMRLLQEGLRLDPDSDQLKQAYKRAKQVNEWMTTAQRHLFSRNFQEAADLWTQCIQHYKPLPPKAPLYANLYTQRAKAYLKLKLYPEALKDCALVLYAQEDHIPAYMIKFQAHHGLQEHSAVLEQVKDLLQKWPQHEQLRQAYERADFLVRQQRRVDFYKLFGVPSIASEMEIKKAYKRKALQLHPDKQAPGGTEEEQKKAQRQFQQLGDGLEILCDDFQRKLYDEGYDPVAIRERVEAANQAAHNHRGRYNPHGHGHGHH
jgi:tetratricopeptide (TPR) repeat protein